MDRAPLTADVCALFDTANNHQVLFTKPVLRVCDVRSLGTTTNGLQLDYEATLEDDSDVQTTVVLRKDAVVSPLCGDGCATSGLEGGVIIEVQRMLRLPQSG